MWTDEATFTRGGIINHRNSHVWAHENPRTVREYRFQHEFARSPDLTPVDFFVWGALKQEVYSLPVNSREQLRDRIVAAVHQISPDQCLAATRAVRTRCNACIAARGQHFEQYLHLH
ncbi:hypothetical protein X777_06399 [Ooceraea biroi]|uniref:Uncharacterized protein n=1 Tax=Ooceraea biroi TaxID=2015173 RepID=A0A026WB84_OOCBI|nr:hypothetical protein X777_06399 [Ooceraea biroi]